MPFKQWLQKLFTFKRAEPAPAVAPGLYHALQEEDGAYTRFHLRVERDGSGMLIADANAAARLNPSGVLIARGLQEGWDEAQILAALQAQFHGATEETLREGVAQVEALFESLASPGDQYPIFNLDDPALSPRGAQLIAPLQADVPQAPPEQLVPLLARLWEVGIPHVCFLAPQTFEPQHLVRAVERAEDLGLIAGVRGTATALGDEGLLADLVQAGADYVRLLYAAADAETHDALCGAGDHAAAVAIYDWLEAREICAVAEVPLVAGTVERLEETFAAMAALGVDNIAFVAYATTDAALDDGALHADALPQVAALVEESSAQVQMRFLWEPPVQRDPAQPLAAQVLQGPRASGDVSIRLEPDGTVIPPRGPYRPAGNLLTDEWERIWNDAAFRVYRERVEAPTHCEHCPGLAICAADCPREPAGWSQSTRGGAA